MERNYQKFNLKINYSKSKIILNTNNVNIKKYIKDKFPQYKKRYDGAIKYLGIPHGPKHFINQETNKLFKSLRKKLLYISSIMNRQIRTQLYKRFLNYNNYNKLQLEITSLRFHSFPFSYRFS